MINPREADEFVATAHRHYDALRERVDELTDRGPGALWSSASIDLDFKFDDQAKASVIAEGDISDSSTHHLEVVLKKP